MLARADVAKSSVAAAITNVSASRRGVFESDTCKRRRGDFFNLMGFSLRMQERFSL